jgi:hypothetical protein
MDRRQKRIRNECPRKKREANLIRRYGIDIAEYEAMLQKQNNLCALCGGVMERPVIDHNHQTGRVRAILCHPCNIKLPNVEDMGWVMLAWAYLEEYDS